MYRVAAERVRWSCSWLGRCAGEALCGSPLALGAQDWRCSGVQKFGAPVTASVRALALRAVVCPGAARRLCAAFFPLQLPLLGGWLGWGEAGPAAAAPLGGNAAGAARLRLAGCWLAPVNPTVSSPALLPALREAKIGTSLVLKIAE